MKEAIMGRSKDMFATIAMSSVTVASNQRCLRMSKAAIMVIGTPLCTIRATYSIAQDYRVLYSIAMHECRC